MQSQHFLLLKFEVEGIFLSLNHLYTLIFYIFAAQGLYERRFQAYTSLQQGTTCVLCCGPILRYMALSVQNLAVAGHVGQVVVHHKDFSVQNIPCKEFQS